MQKEKDSNLEFDKIIKTEEKDKKIDIQELYGTIRYPDPLPKNPKTIEKVVKIKYHKTDGFMDTPTFW